MDLKTDAGQPNYDPRQNLEIGVGASMGLLDDNVHVGFGWNLSAPKDQPYITIGLDFLKTIDSFSSVFASGGGGTQ